MAEGTHGSGVDGDGAGVGGRVDLLPARLLAFHRGTEQQTRGRRVRTRVVPGVELEGLEVGSHFRMWFRGRANQLICPELKVVST